MAVPTKEEMLEALRPVQDPEIRIGIVDLGLVYDVSANDAGEATIKMTLTTPACPYGEVLLTQAHNAIEKMDGITKVEVELVWEPVWNPDEMCSDLAKDQLGIW